ncbi:MAG: phage major capsid protein [Clostridia bacterium]|nr:phage major capsid protein [Clostridia bacterium]
MITLQNADSALKDYYLEAVTAQLNENLSPFFSAIEKNSANVSGKDVKLTVLRGYAGGIVSGAEDADLPAPHKNRYAAISVPLKNLYGTIEISDKALRASRDSEGAFINLLNAEMEGLVNSAKASFQRMLHGDGSGKLCAIVKKISNTEVQVDDVKEYFAGMLVDCSNAMGLFAESSKGVMISGVDMANSTVIFETAVTSSLEGGYMYVHASKDRELTGLSAIFDSGTIYGYDKSTDKYFAPYKVDCNHKLTESVLSDVLDHMEERYNSKINFILCSYKTRKLIASLLDANRRVVNTIDARTGYGSVTVNDVPVYADKYCPDDRILFLNTDDFGLYQLCDWEWLEDEDGKILKQVAGKAAYSATLVKYAELICRKPCGQAMLYNVHPVNGTSPADGDGE